MKKFMSLLRDNRGISSLEYAILAGVVITALVAGLGTGDGSVKQSITTLFTHVTTSLTNATTL